MPEDPENESRADRIRRKAKERRQAEMMKDSIHKASTARAHRRPPPLVRKGTARASALEMLSSFMDLSVTILHEQLYAEVKVGETEDGTPIFAPDHKARRQAAQMVIDKVASAEGTYLPEGMDVVVDAENVVATGSKVVDLVLSGQLSVEAGVKVFGLLEKQAQLEGLKELDDLRAMIAQLSGEHAKTINGVPGSSQHPAWLRLNKNTEGETDGN